MESSVLRLLDANANRAREALRVVEDYARFVLDDGEMLPGYLPPAQLAAHLKSKG